jgi:hypothetical protein
LADRFDLPDEAVDAGRWVRASLAARGMPIVQLSRSGERIRLARRK